MRKFFLNLALLLSALIVGSSSVWAADPIASFAPSDFSGQGTTGTGSSISATKSTITFACDKGYGTTQIRCYSGGTITISSANTIKAISFTFSGSYTGGLETSYTDLSTTSWTKKLTSQARITACTVTYTSAETRTPIATDVSITDPGTLTVEATGTFVGVSSDAAACTKSWTSSNSSIIEIKDAAAGTYEAKGRGTANITYTITPNDAVTYAPVYAERSVTVTTPVVITASDVEMTYGDAAKGIGASTTVGYGGTLSYTSANENIATVSSSGVVTAVAVGETTITIHAGNNLKNFFTESDKVINVTVNQIPGGTAALLGGFVKETSTVTDGQYLIVYEDGNVAFDGGLETLDATENTIDVSITNGVIAATATTLAAAFTIDATEGTIQSASGYYIGQATDANGLATSTETAYTNTLTIDEGDADVLSSGGARLRYNSASNQLRFRYYKSASYAGQQAIQLYKLNDADISVTLNDDGYATFCSEYPLDFSDYETADYSAWYVTSANTSTGVITFSQIKGTIKGGQGILLKGTPNATITLNSVNSSNELSGNILVGCLAPTYVDQVATYYALVHVDTPEAHSEFQNLGSYTGIIPAGKAYLDLTSLGAAPDRLRIVFEENNATSINKLNANNNVVKFFENGQLFIKKNGITYDTLGRIVK